jgi:dipeptidyl aminopeptidase/acylaminoacyl peptidase
MSMDLESGERSQLSTNATGFRTAAVSPDGELTAFAEASERGATVRCDRDGAADSTEVATFEGGVALSFRPGTRELAVAVTTGSEAGVFRDLYVVDVERGGEPRRLVHGPLLAYWWAPTGDRLAVLVPAYTGDGRYQLRFHGPDGRFLRAMEPVTLSPDSRTMVSFFDQFALSHRPWSPDGRRFAFGGRLLTDAIPASFADGQLDAVVVADAVAGGPWTRVGWGFAGFYPPREVNGR